MRHAWYLQLIPSALIIFLLLGISGRVALGDPTNLQDRSDELSSSLPGVRANNLIGFTITDTSQPLGSIELQFCSNSPLPDENCIAPAGLDASEVGVASQTGNTGFSVASNSTTNTVILTRSPAIPTTSANSYELDNILNPNAQGAYFLRVYVYPTTDGSGPETQDGGVALATNNALTVSAEVPPYLNFCTGLTISNQNCATATGYSIDFGNLSDQQASSGTSEFVVGTNAQSGYTVTVNGPTLTSGNNVISASSTPTPSVIGSSQFGINLRANASPPVGSDPVGSGYGVVTDNYDQANRFTYIDGDTLVSSDQNTLNQTFTISYLTNVGSAQATGVYVTTLTFICLANF